MAGQHNVDAVNGSELQRGVLHARNMFAAGYAGMRESHDDIDALFAHFWNPGLGSLNDVAHDDLAGKVGGVPGHDLGWQETDNADADRMGGTGPVGQFLFKNAVG